MGWQTFPIKGKTVKVLDFVGHSASIAPAQFCCYNVKAGRDNT